MDLTPQESEKMLFWNYYKNANAPNKIMFGSGLHRYISDDRAIQILRDIISIKKQESDKKYMQEFLQFYCMINGLNEKSVPLPNGALLHCSK